MISKEFSAFSWVKQAITSGSTVTANAREHHRVTQNRNIGTSHILINQECTMAKPSKALGIESCYRYLMLREMLHLKKKRRKKEKEMASSLLEYLLQSLVPKPRNLPQLNLRSSVLLDKDGNEGSHSFRQMHYESLELILYFQSVMVATACK